MVCALKTNRLLIQSMGAAGDDLLLILVAWLNDANMMKFSEQRHRSHSLESQREYINKQDQLFRIYNIFKLGADVLTIGTLTLYIDPNNYIGDMGLLIGKEFAGQGYGCEAWYGLYDHLLLTHEVQKIEAGHMQVNRAMFNICRKRMRFEGARRHHFLYGDQERCDKFLWGSM